MRAELVYTPKMNKRLEMLEKLVSSGQADSFARYGLAMEYRKGGRADDALHVFETLREKDPSYLPMYLMAGQMLIDVSREDEARVWLEQGILLATKQGNGKAQNELEAALAQCD